LLDVTYLEPPLADSSFYTLPNVYLSTQISGSSGNEAARMADYVLEESARLQSGEALRYAVSLAMLDTMA
jgi:phosphoglycerate dehydrogenase-like enzyme